MSKIKVLLFFGFLLIVFPYLGFPNIWKDVMLNLLGISIIFISYSFYGEYKKKHNKKKSHEIINENDFIENI